MTDAQRGLLTYLLNETHETLRRLRVVTEHLSLHILHAQHWPQLRILHLSGERQFSPDMRLPYIALLSRMPGLRELVLDLADPTAAGPQAIWPAGYDTVYPWTMLERLTLSQPDPDDSLFSHLPASLRTLSLRHYPREYLYDLEYYKLA